MSDAPEGRRGRSAPSRRLRALPSEPIREREAPPSREPVEFRGRQRLALIRDLAMGEWDAASLATKYGAVERDIAAFALRYHDEIAEVSAALSGTVSIETAGLWTTRKQQRLAELQQGIEDIDAALTTLRDQGVAWSRAHRDMFRARLDLYRQIAEELGAYPQRQAPPVRTGASVAYTIDMDGPEALQ